MNKIKGSILARIIAWIVLIISGVSFAGSIAAAFIFTEVGVYSRAYEDVKKEYLNNRARDYAIKALMDYKAGQDDSYLTNNGVSYGIVKLKSIDQNINSILLNSNSSYVRRNFHYDISINDTYSFIHEVTQNSYFHYNPGLFGWSYIDEPYYNAEWDNYYVNIGYDINHGIFYFYSPINDQIYYPIKRVALSFRGCEYVYDFDRNIARYELTQIYYSGDSVNVEEVELYQENEAEIDEAETTESQVIENKMPFNVDEVQAILESQYVDFAKLWELGFDNKYWGKMCFEDRREVYVDTSMKIFSLMELHNPENDYYLTDQLALKVQNQVEREVERYCVIMPIVEEITPSLSGNGYQKMVALLELAYKLKYDIVVIIIITFVIALVAFIFLMCIAGHKKNQENIKEYIFQKIPWEINIVVIGVVEGVGIALLDEIVPSIEDVIMLMYIIGIVGTVMAVTAILFCLDFAIRFKLGKWWRRTITYFLLSKLWKLILKCIQGIKYFVRSIRLQWRIWVIVFGVMLVNFILFLIMIEIWSSHEALLLMMIVIVFELIALGLFVTYITRQMAVLQQATERMANGELDEKIDTAKMLFEIKKHGDNLNRVNEGIAKAVNERMKSEHFKTELITNVSHDIKTPLTSIINYVDLLEKENLENENAVEYLEVLDRQSSKLKKLIEDLVEASKASSGNLPVNYEQLDLGVFLTQTAGEWTERLEQKNLQLVVTKPEAPVYIKADGRHLWRVVDNLMNNICKYALPGSRVYINLEEAEMVILTFRNISEYPLNISTDELMERFVRGDKSRNSEGHGLGLSIAQSLMALMDGQIELYIDGDLFKVNLSFPKMMHELS